MMRWLGKGILGQRGAPNAILVSVMGLLVFTSCEEPKSKAELVLSAKIKMDKGECGAAVSQLESIATDDRDDNVNNTLGWAYMCRAGAPFYRIGSSVLNYKSGSGSLTVVGQLANSLVPLPAGALDDADPNAGDLRLAYKTFGDLSPSKATVKNFSQGIAKLVEAAAWLARSSTDGKKVRAADITSGYATCATTVAVCDCAGGSPPNCQMTDVRANAFFNAATAAVTAFGGNTSFSNLVDIVNQLAAYGIGQEKPLRQFIITQVLVP